MREPFPMVPVWVPGGPRVFSKRRGNPPGPFAYVGRPTLWGNPYPLESEAARERSIRSYEAFLLGSGLVDRAVRDLAGLHLLCWCAPKLCHAHVLLWYANPEATPLLKNL